MSSLFKKLDRFPPVRVRLAAVHYPNGPKKWPVPLCDDAIAEHSLLSTAEVRYISQLTSWDDLSLKKIRMFIQGCRVNLGNWGALARVTKITARGKFFYLRRDPLWDEQYKRLVEIWENDARRTDTAAR